MMSGYLIQATKRDEEESKKVRFVGEIRHLALGVKSHIYIRHSSDVIRTPEIKGDIIPGIIST